MVYLMGHETADGSRRPRGIRGWRLEKRSSIHVTPGIPDGMCSLATPLTTFSWGHVARLQTPCFSGPAGDALQNPGVHDTRMKAKNR